MGIQTGKALPVRPARVKRYYNSNLAYKPQARRKPHGPREFWFTPTIFGWPGWRTRQGRSGFDPIDYQIEFAHIQGVFIRQFLTFTYRTRDPLALFFVGSYAAIAFTAWLFTLQAFSSNAYYLNKDIAPYYWFTIFVPSTVSGIIGFFGFINIGINLGTIMQPLFNILDLDSTDPEAIEQCAVLLTEGFKKHWSDAWPTHEEALAEVRGMLAPDRICRIAVDKDGNVVGWIGGLPEYDGNVWELHPLVVKPDQQQQGIGRLLVQDFEREVKKRGGLTIRLGTDDEDGMTSLANTNLYEDTWDKIADIQNLKGHPYEFYQKLGYTIIGVMPDANGRGKPDIIMGKKIS